MTRTAQLPLLVALALAAACGSTDPRRQPFCPGSQDLAALVDPRIGSAGPGNVAVGALVPHGMVRLGPATNTEAGSVEGYAYENDRIRGFTHTQLHGAGGSNNGYAQLLFLPLTGPVEGYPLATAARFSHTEEQVSPGLYTVRLQDTGIQVELTASSHAGLHRYTFPAGADARVLIDLGHSLGDSRGGQVEFPDSRTVEGFGEYNVHPLLDLLLTTPEQVTGRSRVYFHARFSRPFTSAGTFKRSGEEYLFRAGTAPESGPWIGAWLGFGATAAEPLEVRVGLSLLSTDLARQNLEAELGERGFEEVAAEARARWNCLLSRVEVEGGTQAERVEFYTALYHSLFQPANLTEAGGRFWSGADGQGAEFKVAGGRRYVTDDWCAWDTFRTSRPLGTLLDPEWVEDTLASYLHLFRQGGWLEKCSWQATGYSRVMIGNHVAAILADALVKGFEDYDLGLAWEALWKSATEDNAETFRDGLCGYFNLGTPPEYILAGYVGHECDPTQSASMTLEYAYDDWCTAQVAAALGRPDEHQQLMLRAQNFRNQWNPATGFMQARRRDGTFVEPFDPAAYAQDFCESDAWTYTWFVPHDVPSLIELLGGREAFLTRLDRYFDEGHFDPSNEPGFHAPYLYNLAGAPARTQARVQAVLAGAFSERPDGLPGNDDAGATSAWFVLGALGLYPLAPGDGVYQLSSPLFERVVIHLHPGWSRGSTFVIEAPGSRGEAPYIQSASLDGAPLEVPRIRHDRITAGGRLVFQMGPEPSTWGAATTP
ncbi:MAG TPA: GH92 family glycosyl hydrolase [Myxococcota bacterium]|nr:GH92 family glycosyl hydrolase [Myxococcota bacterium]HRY96108.1 GH92 family glycosyl hydrolase [Myxococcota bacterium]HSA23429.1 GH92 family glycosyl hydrolase [Myxococcota bacterium]